MAQDFAKKKNTSSTPSKKKPVRSATRNTNAESSNHWSWYFSGLFSGLLLCVIGYVALTQLDNGATISDVVDSIQDTDNEQNNPGTELEFYEYLPQAEVEVNVVPVEIASSAIETEANQINYLLQAGSFLDPNDAEALRARLILMNLDTRIQPHPLSGRTWYRVQSGPFLGRNAVEAAENIMIENNIDPIRMRIPSP
jgi:cell division protein FtsN